MKSIKLKNNLSIEQMREIVSGAPKGATIISLATHQYFRKLVNPIYGNMPNVFVRVRITENGLLEHSTRFAPIILPIELNDLRTAIAKHDEDHCNHEWNDMTSNGDNYRSLVCKHCDSTKNYLPLDEDHVTDIRNHVSPSTIVKDLEAERHG
ncbi:hypothetical protein [Acinetobacter bereziniae]|uniref:hypothetical protein n=1 Tax=Acinetobacter bereziniae TaxID=106648 RepID=UPI0005A76EA3|nr:hypothetical protein [Acinetobacter bereziniae]